MSASLPALLSPASITVLGPTASGKTALAVALARRLDGEILSVDSRMVYRELDLGCGKDRHAYGSGPQAVPVHGMDLCGLDHEFSLFDYRQAALAAHDGILARGGRPILCGGSGLYLDCLLAGYDLQPRPQAGPGRRPLESLDDARLQELYHRHIPAPHNTTDTLERPRLIRALEIAGVTDTAREGTVSLEPQQPAGPGRRGAAWHPGLVLGLRPTRDDLRTRIRARLLQRLEEGLLEEGRALLAAGHPAERLARLGLEYRWLMDHLVGGLSYPDFVDGLEIAIRHFARRQWMWFRRMERQGLVIHWLDLPEGTDPVPQLVQPALEQVAEHDARRTR